MRSGARTDGMDERFDRAQTRDQFVAYSASKDPKVRDELVVAHLNLVR
jgi:hypothetical protein